MLRTAVLAVLLALLPAAAQAAPPPVQDRPTEVEIGDGAHRVVVTKDPWRLTLRRADGTVVAGEAASTPLGAMPNPDRALYEDRFGAIDLAYPGLSEVSYQPLAYRRNGTWQRVTRLTGVAADGDAIRLQAATSDGGRATVRVALEDGGATVRLGFAPEGPGVDAVSEAFAAPVGERYLGGGQRFGALDQRGRSVPLWISHGQDSDRHGSTNEAAVPFLMSTGGWGFGVESDARGELNVAVPNERPDALNVVLEQDRLDLLLFAGPPRQVLSAYTERAGRPDPAPPAWAFRPAYWRDEGTSQAQIEEYVGRLRREGIPIGAVWIDNPWQSRSGDLAPSPERFGDFDAMVRGLNARDIRVMAWASPYADAESRVGRAATPAGFVDGLPADGNDQTYLPPRGLDPHLDLTDPRAFDALADAAADLVRRGVDGFKADRGEEDLGDASKWANGLPNRLNHNAYVVRYHAALAEGCRRAGRAAECFVIARGGARGGQRHASLWAADNLSAPGALGLEQALRSLLSLSVSGYPVSGSDIGGYVGTREATGAGSPTRGLFLRWTQLGALSPVMQTLSLPWDFDEEPETVRIFRRFANLHTRLAPHLKRWSDEAARTGVPIVRPLPYALPDDPVAVRIDDQYLLGPDLLVAPITQGISEGAESRQVYLPAGRWRDVWTGAQHTGPTTLVRSSPLDEMPLYLREGGELPAKLFEGLDARAVEPEPPGMSPSPPSSGPPGTSPSSAPPGTSPPSPPSSAPPGTTPSSAPGPAPPGSSSVPQSSAPPTASGPSASGGTPCRDVVAPRSRVTARRAARDGLHLRGSAVDRACSRRAAPARVRVAVLLRTGRRCRPVAASGRLGTARSCLRTVYRTVRGTARWSTAVRGPLRRGSYLVWIRAIDRAGNVERKDRGRNLTRLRIR